jgi:hypothetical protein
VLPLWRERSGRGKGTEIGSGSGSGSGSGRECEKEKEKGRGTEIIRSLNASASATCTTYNSSQWCNRDTDTLPRLININMYILSHQVNRTITWQHRITTTAHTIITSFITTMSLDSLKEVLAGMVPHLCRLEAQDPYTVLVVPVNMTLLAVPTHTPTLNHNHNHIPILTLAITSILPRLSISRRQSPPRVIGRATSTLRRRYRPRLSIGIERGICALNLLESRGDQVHVQWWTIVIGLLPHHLQ